MQVAMKLPWDFTARHRQNRIQALNLGVHQVAQSRTAILAEQVCAIHEVRGTREPGLAVLALQQWRHARAAERVQYIVSTQPRGLPRARADPERGRR